MYHETTPFIIFICNKKRAHGIFFEKKITNNVAENLDFDFRVNKHFPTSSALQTSIPPDSCLLLRLSQILNIFNVSYSSSLNRLNTISLYQNLEKLVMCRIWVMVLLSKAVQ